MNAPHTWPAPDMTLLNAGRRPPPQMPGKLFSPVWELLMDIADGTATPIDYPALSFLATCASLVGGKRQVRPYKTSSWTEPCIVWVGLVGDPSSRKSPALAQVTAPLAKLELDGAGRHEDALRQWHEKTELAKVVESAWQQAVKEAVKTGQVIPPLPTDAIYPDEPVRRRPVVMDATPEAVGMILSGNPMGTLHVRDELSGWIVSFDRYSPGGREFWLEAYGGRPYVIDRKGTKQPVKIPFNGVSVLGGIQPGKLAESILASTDDGLVARILWAWPDKRPCKRPERLADIARLERIYQRLEDLAFACDGSGQSGPRILPLSERAADIFERWQIENSQLDEDSSNLFKAFVGKMDGTVLRLALICELVAWAVRGGMEPEEVTQDCVAAAIEWVELYAKPMAERVYGDAALPEVERNASLLARYIVKNGIRQFNKRELKRSPHKSALPQLRTANAMDAAVHYLVDAGWALGSGAPDGAVGRAPANFLVNPAVFGR